MNAPAGRAVWHHDRPGIALVTVPVNLVADPVTVSNGGHVPGRASGTLLYDAPMQRQGGRRAQRGLQSAAVPRKPWRKTMGRPDPSFRMVSASMTYDMLWLANSSKSLYY